MYITPWYLDMQVINSYSWLRYLKLLDSEQFIIDQERTGIKLLGTLDIHQGGKGYWAVYYTSSQSFIITFSYSFALQLWRLQSFMDMFILEKNTRKERKREKIKDSKHKDGVKDRQWHSSL